MTRDLSLIFTCYGQPRMMRRQEESWLSYPESLAKRIQVIVVDDCGTPPYEPGTDLASPAFDFQVYHVDKNIPWNQMGARNLGMKQASAPWRLMLDADMVLDASNLARIFEMRLKKGHHYKPKLVPCARPHSSPNLYICHVDDFWKAGGYNEDFAGAKGYSDVILHRTLFEVSRRHHLDRISIEFVSPNLIPDADVRSLDRDLARNEAKFRAAMRFAAKNSWKLYAHGVQNHIRFPWSRVR